MVVDDDAEFLAPLCEFLSISGYEVKGFTSGKDALDMMKEATFDLLLTDLVMPEMDGVALLKATLEIDPHLVGIVITGQGTIQTAVEAMKVGAFDYVVKPFEFRMLAPLLARALGVRRLRMENAQLRETVETYRLKQALQESEDRLHLLKKAVESLPIGITVSDTEGRIVYTNPAEAEIHGYTVEELMGRNARMFAPPELWKPITFAQMYEIGIFKRESVNVQKNGKAFPVQLTSIAVKNEKGIPIGIITVSEDITERKQAEKEIRNYQKSLRALVSELLLIEERERRGIASDLHDTIGQSLALSRIKLGALRELFMSGDHAAAVDEIRELIEQSLQYTRSLTSELSPPVLYEIGFEAAVEWLAEQIQAKHGVLIDIRNDGQPKPLDDEVRVFLYKAVRELLINVVKHAHARRGDISIERNGAYIQIVVKDDGVGFDTAKIIPEGNVAGFGFGLFNIRERLESIEGFFEVKSEPGNGTQVAITAPLKQKGRKGVL